jgi:hypothetical protein
MRKTFYVFITLMFLLGCEAMTIHPGHNSIWVNKDARRQNYINFYSETPLEIKQLILEGKIQIGMTQEQVEASWGYPNEVSSYSGRRGLVECWQYGKGSFGRYTKSTVRFLYFNDRVLTGWYETMW